MNENALAGEKSPYLLQHKTNPVDWRPWGEEAFAEARRRKVPVFLSIGYSTCHWCHVMAHESFEDAAIAGQMNSDFVNIKVDREERPDVDRLYMAFVQATTGSGGWPMSVWLTPEGKPFFGGTYFPPEDRYGRAGFPQVLRQIADLWDRDQPRVEKEGARVMETLGQSKAGSGETFSSSESSLQQAVEEFSRSFDPIEGGFGSAPKFPRPSTLNFLGRSKDRDLHAAEMADFTLRKMAAGGVRDHLGGGFHRYAVDGAWHVPHFEKMLYDQAQLVVSYVEAWQRGHEEFFAEVARETLEYVLRDMTHPEGGFYSAEDADSLLRHGSEDHAEGAFYVWSRAEIDEVLGGEAAEKFCRHYGVEANGNAPEGSDPHGEFTGLNILIERGTPESAPALVASRKKLLARRATRPRPHLDDKVLTAWNGLMISALARAGAAFSEPCFLEAAAKAAQFLQTHLTKDGRLLRTWRGEAGTIGGFAEDYAFLIQGLLDLYEATFDDHWLRWAVDLQAIQDELFWDVEAGGGYFSSAGGDPLVPVRMKEDYDGAEPSANSVSAGNLLRLARMLDAGEHEIRAREILASHQDQMTRIPTAVPQMLVALDLALSPPAQAVVAGRPDSPEVREWIAELHSDFHPRRVLMSADGAGLPAMRNPSVAQMQPVDGRAALYLCENFTCQRPVVRERRMTAQTRACDQSALRIPRSAIDQSIRLTKTSRSKRAKSSTPSPLPMKRVGIPSSFWIATATPPLPLPSSLVSTIPVRPTAWWNSRACTSALDPVVASTTRRHSWGASGSCLARVRFTLESSCMRLSLV